jgi:flagellar biogenesis protein FliO
MVMAVLASARSAGHVSGVLLFLGVVGWGILRLGRRARISRPLTYVAVVAVLSFTLFAAGAASH